MARRDQNPNRAEQFSALPARAMSDKRLSANDFRVLAAIAFHDRFGRNGQGCYVKLARLADEAEVNPAHLGRHTKRLEEFGYLSVERSNADQRRRVYRILYEEASKKVTKAGGKSHEFVTNEESQPTENKRILLIHKRSGETKPIDSAKQCSARQNATPKPAEQSSHASEPGNSLIKWKKEKLRNLAVQRLGNDLNDAQLKGNLVELLETKLGVSLASSKAYKKAIECECERRGSGLAYLYGVLRRRKE